MHRRNIYGEKLQPCSTSGMALAGATSSGYCFEKNDESNSHHVCINLSSNSDFCDMTKQSKDWCSDEKVCDNGYGSSNGAMCSIENWCACQWSFATYIQNIGGCEFVQDLKCNAIHLQTIKSYVNMIATRKDRDDRISNALNCIVSKCGLNNSEKLIQMYSSQQSSKGHKVMGALFSILIIVVAGYTMYKFCWNCHMEDDIIINTDDPDDYFAMGKTLWKGKWIETSCF